MLTLVLFIFMFYFETLDCLYFVRKIISHKQQRALLSDQSIHCYLNHWHSRINKIHPILLILIAHYKYIINSIHVFPHHEEKPFQGEHLMLTNNKLFAVNHVVHTLRFLMASGLDPIHLFVLKRNVNHSNAMN